MKSYGVVIRIKATEQNFALVLFIKLYKVDETLKCDHLNESYRIVLHYVADSLSFFNETEFALLFDH